MPKPKAASIPSLPSAPTQASFVSRGSASAALLPSANPLVGLAKAKTNKPTLVGGVA